jgi:hypothetical protein
MALAIRPCAPAPCLRWAGIWMIAGFRQCWPN